MKKILITGANGQLGQEIRLLASNYKNQFFFAGFAASLLAL